MFNLSRFHKFAAAPDEPTPGPHDARLAQALRSLPVPAASPDFDREVFAQLGTFAPPRRLHLPVGLLPRLAALSVLATLLLPATRAVLRTEAQAQWNWVFGSWYLVPLDQPDSTTLAPQERWVASLPLFTEYEPNWRIRKNAATLHVRTIDQRGESVAGLNRSTVDALQGLRNQYRNNPAFLAARLRHGLGNGVVIEPVEARRRARFHGDKDVWQRRHQISLSRLEADAARGAELEPRNAFFPTMQAAVLFSKGQEADAARALRTLAGKPEWNDYSRVELITRYRYEKARGAQSVLDTGQILSREMFPDDTLRRIAWRAAGYAARVEDAKRLTEGAATRAALLDLAASLMTPSNSLNQNRTASAILYAAQQKLGGWEGAFAPDGVPTEGRYDLTLHQAGLTGTKRRGREATKIRQARSKWEAGRRARLVAFLRANGEPGRAEWARRLLEVEANRDKAARAARNVVKLDESARLRAAVWGDLAPSVLRLKAGWVSLNPLAAVTWTALIVGGLLAGLCRLPFLKRREEFPAWAIVGGIVGSGATLLCVLMSGLYGINVVLLPWPAFAALVLGVGYLRLRRPRLIVLCALAALVVVWPTRWLIDACLPLLARAVYTWLGTPLGGYRAYQNTQPDPLAGWAAAPVMLVLIVLIVALTHARYRGATWQATCQHVARRSVTVAAVFALVFSVLVGWIAIGEASIERQLLAAPHNLAVAPQGTHLPPVPVWSVPTR